MLALAVVPQRLVGHDRPEVGAADADVDDVADALAGVALPRAAADAVRRSPPSCRARRGPRARRSRRRPRSTRPCGARRATCSTARFSVTLILSPRNIASMRSRRPDSSASCTQQLERLVGDAVLRVVEEEAGGLERSGARRASGRRRRGRAGAARRPSGSAPRAPSRPGASRERCATRRRRSSVVSSPFRARRSWRRSRPAARSRIRRTTSAPSSWSLRGQRVDVDAGLRELAPARSRSRRRRPASSRRLRRDRPGPSASPPASC